MITHDRFDNSPAPVRVLMSAHSFAKDVSPETQAELLARYHARLAEEEARAVAPKPIAALVRPAKPALRKPQAKVWSKPAPSRSVTRKLINPEDVRRLHAQGKTVAEMQQILGCAHSPIYRQMRELGVRTPERRAVVAIDDVFGQLTVRQFLRFDPKQGRMFLCACACGNEKEVAVKNLRAKKHTSCGCAARIWRQRTNPAVAQSVIKDVEAGCYSMREVAKRNGVSRAQVGRLIERDRMRGRNL